ncbi:hypothetical protein [Bacillus ndiopicus]|uniref:hypothetical protein n=1 Tax=Bacillus ndiopicus TaxID=1347368 RepID=UPI0005AB6199|nr:hypothetical protein [Bacillus ndiopicus]
MKEKITSFEDFAQRLKEESMQIEPWKGIVVQQKKSCFIKIKIAPSLVMLFTFLFVTSTVVAAFSLTNLQFFGKDEQPMLNMYEMTEEEAKPHFDYDEFMGKHRGLLKRLREDLANDQYLAFLDVEAYEALGESALTYTQRPKKFEDFSQIPADFSPPFLLKEKLLGEIQFEELTYMYNYETRVDNLAQSMYQEALRLNVPYITTEHKLNTTKIDYISLMYGGFDFEYGFQITIQPVSDTLHTTENLSHYTKVVHEGEEFYYSESDQTLLYVHQTQTEQYLLEIRQTIVMADAKDKIPLEKLLAIAEELIP